MLVIADEQKPIGLAGIMGGENSEIMDDTTTVVFESANFNGTSIRQTALALGMRTESSGKFEKNLDPMMTVPAVQRACELVELLECGDVLDGIIDIINYVPEAKELTLEPEKINKLLGTEISKEQMVEYLNLLEIDVDGDIIKVPSFRPDLNLMADIAEEVGRSYGYNEIPTTAFKTSTQGGFAPIMLMENQAGQLCRALGFSEIITYSFVSPMIFDQIRLPKNSVLRNAMRIQNPLGEDTSIMRTIALPSMLDILGRNYAYHNKSVKLYELAKIYLPAAGQDLPAEPKMLMLGSYGAGETFFKLKGELEAILNGLNLPKTSYTACQDNPSYHPGRCAAVSMDGIQLGYMGQVHPLVAKNYGIDTEVYCVEIDFSKLFDLKLPEPTYVPLPKYPGVSRDLSLICDEQITVAQIEDVITASAGKLLRGVKLFDIYRGVGVPEGKKSMAFSLELRADDRTLTDADSEAVTAKVLAAVEEKLGAKLR
jgi:phenylalanyl-tRNA synthetase beta chain